MTQALPALCLLIVGVILLALAILISRAPAGKETPGVGFEKVDRTPKG